jgi:hypothetical protein
MLRTRFPAVLAALALGACGAIETPPSGQPAPETVAQASVQGGRFISLVGPRRQFTAPFLGVPGTNYYALRSLIDQKSGNEVTQLYVEDSYVGTRRDYEAAQDAAAAVLKFVVISRDEITCEPGCSYAEEFAADLPAPLLQANTQGLIVTFSAKSGPALTIAVPADLIEKQLAAVDAARAALPEAAASAPKP